MTSDIQSVKDDQFTASSSETSFTPSDARLDAKGWQPRSDDVSPWIQIDFHEPVSFAGIITRGLKGSPVWTKHYTITYSEDCLTFKDVNGPDGKPEVISLNPSFKIAADYCLNFLYYSEKPRHDILCELSARQSEKSFEYSSLIFSEK